MEELRSEELSNQPTLAEQLSRAANGEIACWMYLDVNLVPGFIFVAESESHIEIFEADLVDIKLAQGTGITLLDRDYAGNIRSMLSADRLDQPHPLKTFKKV